MRKLIHHVYKTAEGGGTAPSECKDSWGSHSGGFTGFFGQRGHGGHSVSLLMGYPLNLYRDITLLIEGLYQLEPVFTHLLISVSSVSHLSQISFICLVGNYLLIARNFGSWHHLPVTI